MLYMYGTDIPIQLGDHEESKNFCVWSDEKFQLRVFQNRQKRLKKYQVVQ